MTNEATNTTYAQVLAFLEEGRRAEAAALIEPLLPPDQVEIFTQLPIHYQTRLIKVLAVNEAANIFEFLDDDEAALLAQNLDIDSLIRVLNEMEPDEAADLLGDLGPELREQSLERITDASDIKTLLRYPDDTAGGLMTLDYYAFPEDTPVGEVFNYIRSQATRDEEIPFVFAVDNAGKLKGIVRLSDLIRAHPQQYLSLVMNTQFISIEAKQDQEIASQLLNRYDLLALPVVDEKERMIGVITIDDAIEALEEEATEDIYKSAGILSPRDSQAVKSDLMVSGPIWKSWLVRIPFLLVTMIGGMLAGGVIGVYEEALETVVALAFFIPVVMDMGGNSGTQSVGIFIRGFVLGQIDTKQFSKHLLREIVIGLGLGIILGSISGVIATLWQGSSDIGLVVGLAIVCTITLATSLGFIVPLVIEKLGIDPAVASEPIITTIKDITGMLIYFFFATLFVSNLI